MRGLRNTAVDVVVMLLAAYLQAAALVRCARAVITPPPALESAPNSVEPPEDRAAPRRTVRVSRGPAESPGCPGLSASIVSLSPDVASSLATLRSDRGSELVQLGSRAGELRVAAIHEREVVLAGSGRTCRAPLGRGLPPDAPSAAPGPVRVPRALRDRVLARPDRLLAGARLLPIREGGAPVALSGEHLAPGALLASLGLRAGDRIRSVNGWTLARASDGIQAWAALSRADQFAISIERDGRPLQLDVRLD